MTGQKMINKDASKWEYDKTLLVYMKNIKIEKGGKKDNGERSDQESKKHGP